jgi:hypothetical protein
MSTVTFSPELKRLIRKAGYSPLTIVEVKKTLAFICTPPPIRLHGVVLNYLSTGKILALSLFILNFNAETYTNFSENSAF